MADSAPIPFAFAGRSGPVFGAVLCHLAAVGAGAANCGNDYHSRCIELADYLAQLDRKAKLNNLVNDPGF